jgi:hypothetical protein
MALGQPIVESCLSNLYVDQVLLMILFLGSRVLADLISSDEVIRMGLNLVWLVSLEEGHLNTKWTGYVKTEAETGNLLP